MADHIPWSMVYLVMALFMLIGVIVTIIAPEPVIGTETPRTIRDAIIEPFVEYFKRRDALLMLAFILLYKIGDNMVSGITIPFFLEIISDV